MVLEIDGDDKEATNAWKNWPKSSPPGGEEYTIWTRWHARTGRRRSPATQGPDPGEWKLVITVSRPGVAIGPALVIDTEGVRITHQTIPPEQVSPEVHRLRRALEAAAAEAQEIAQHHGCRCTDQPLPSSPFMPALEDSGLRDQIESSPFAPSATGRVRG
ncbi:MAG: phosphoenolpyruvate-utilizing N-terminal domain-containing protein [Gemmataceae bacterium]